MKKKTSYRLGGIPFEYEGVFCDNCEKEIEEGNVFLFINLHYMKDAGLVWSTRSPEDVLHLCSSECLQSSGIALLLKTKLVPLAQARFYEEDQRDI